MHTRARACSCRSSIQSEDHNGGAGILGAIVEVYTDDDLRYVYTDRPG